MTPQFLVPMPMHIVFCGKNIISCPKSRVYSNVQRYVSKRVPHDIVVSFKCPEVAPARQTSPESKRNPHLVHPSFVDTPPKINMEPGNDGFQ